MTSDHSRRQQRLRKRRLRRLKYSAFASAAVAVLALTTWAFIRIEPSAPDLPLPPLPEPVAAARTPEPTSVATAPSTPDANTPLLRLAVLGDAGTRESMQARVAAQVAAADRQGRRFDALLVTGDLIYEDGDSDLTEASVVRPYSTTFTKPEIIAALGNHDVESDEGSDIMHRLGRSGPVYTQDVGPVRVISLDSNDVDSKQTSWLDQVLSQPRPTTPWVIAIMHHPAFSSGTKHGSEESVQRSWVPVFARHHVNLVLAGHEHNYERSKPQNGVTYIVSGGGGADLYDVGRSSFTATSAKKHHFVDLNVFSDRIEGRAVDVNGQVFDTFRIPRGATN